ncbi:uncharacterized protein LOC119609389 [Lucilia sericata]|uniref:uncharacterized protein LOC119609389 n=1 Tax=Lucilia sericata TaxID=13632 RepID=UPI0018A853E2|nr:uncharacterized protein LOC119609389 [Lucilia sericata]
MCYFLKQFIIFKILLLIIGSCRQAKCETDWTYELLSLKLDSENPEILNGDLYVKRVSRGLFAFSGNLNIFEDLNNGTIVYTDVYYSYTSMDYVRSPFNVPKQPLPQFIKTLYKDMLMESLLQCSSNAPDLEFDGVVTKRVVEFDDCVISNENMPSHMKIGYYKVIFTFTQQITAQLEIIVKIDKKD